MANQGIVANQIGFLPLTLTVNGAVVPTPPDDAFSVVSSGASMKMSIGPDPAGLVTGTGVIFTPQVLESDPGNGGGGFTGNVTDSNGDIALVVGPYDITKIPVTPSIAAGALTFSVNPNVPTAPGP
jgi:hypothetical protein